MQKCLKLRPSQLQLPQVAQMSWDASKSLWLPLEWEQSPESPEGVHYFLLIIPAHTKRPRSNQAAGLEGSKRCQSLIHHARTALPSGSGSGSGSHHRYSCPGPGRLFNANRERNHLSILIIRTHTPLLKFRLKVYFSIGSFSNLRFREIWIWLSFSFNISK